MNLYAHNGRPILMMEAFDGLTSAVDCQGDDGRMSLTFKSADVYKKALNKWSYINEDTDKDFLMITNHKGCGSDEQQRHVYT